MEIRPILSALMRNKVSMILIGLQVALTLAIVCNALFIIGQRMDRMQRPSGMNEADTFMFGSSGFGEGYDALAQQKADLAILRQLPGVLDAAPTNSVPMSEGGWSTGVNLTPEQKTSTASTAIYITDEHGLGAFGLKLVAGRYFKPEDMSVVKFGDNLKPQTIVITQALAEKLFPGADALGKSIYLGDAPPPSTIIVPATAEERTWVVETGAPRADAAMITAAEVNCEFSA